MVNCILKTRADSEFLLTFFKSATSNYPRPVLKCEAPKSESVINAVLDIRDDTVVGVI